VAREVIEYCIRAAGTAPSRANLQSWHFVVVSDRVMKHQIWIGKPVTIRVLRVLSYDKK